MGAVRYTVSPDATVPLRFNDPEFLAALANDEVEVADGEIARPLAKALGVPRASEADFSPYVDDGVVITVRAGITGDDETEWYKAGQGDKDKGWDLTGFQRRLFSMWVRAVKDDCDPSVLPVNLSSHKRTEREAAFGALPLDVYKAFLVRVRVHADAATSPAVRDANKITPKAETEQ